MKNFAERLKKAREYKGLTQSELAALLTVSLRTISNYEKNPTNLTIVNAKKIAHCCGVDENWLLTGQANFSSKDNTASKIIEKIRKINELDPIVCKKIEGYVDACYDLLVQKKSA